MATRLPPLPTISDIVRLFKLQSKKHLAQNFLLDMNLTRKIVRAAGKIKDGYVCEVGPGPGGITRAILEKDVQELAVIEKDRRFIPSLQMLSDVCDNKLKIHHGDVLRFDMSDLFPETLAKNWEDVPPNIHIIGNLPFNVSTALIIQYLEAISEQRGPWKYGRTKMTLTFQKEVAERMVAPIMKDSRCRLSIMCQYLCDVKLSFTIPGKAFVPPPKVDVGVVHIEPLRKPLISQPFKLVEKVNRHVFHYRNKMVKRGIATLFPPTMPELVDEMFELTHIERESRPYMLTVEEMGRFCHVYNHICNRLPYIYDYDYRNPQGRRDIINFRIARREAKKHEMDRDSGHEMDRDSGHEMDRDNEISDCDDINEEELISITDDTYIDTEPSSDISNQHNIT